MTVRPTALVRLGALGQVGLLALGVACWAAGYPDGVLLSAVGYLAVTVAGIAGMARAESLPTMGPAVFPFLLPGFLLLYYLGTEYL